MIAGPARILAVAGAALLSAACGSGGDYRDESVPIETVESVDLGRYMGLWHEIARFPNSFEEGCVGVTAEYALISEDRVSVLNTCRQGSLEGPVETAEGIAWPVDESNARLKVDFVPWVPFTAGDYWILHLDPDYRVTVVGAPSGDYGWILARAPRIREETLASALGALRENGYDTDRIVMVEQPGD